MIEEIIRVVSIIISTLLDEIDDVTDNNKSKKPEIIESKQMLRQMVPILVQILKCRIPTFHQVSDDKKNNSRGEIQPFSTPQEDRQLDPNWIHELLEKCDTDHLHLTCQVTKELPELFDAISDLPV